MKNEYSQKKKTTGTSTAAGNVQGQAVQLQDNRPKTVLQQKQAEQNTVQLKGNKTGLPDNLKSGIENLSGHSMDDVKVHYNSSQPAQLNAHAYAQGNQIHVAPGQEKHLPHEAWHVVQQKQGRVKPTKQLKGKTNINDDAGLEKEADVMGAKALQAKKIESGTTFKAMIHTPVLQAVWNTDRELARLKRSEKLPASKIVPENIKIQQKALADQGTAMRNSQSFSATGYEFEFAQLAPDQKQTEFGKKSHMHLATGPFFPLYPHIPFMVETDMGAVIELAMPPLLIPRDPESKQVDKGWVATVMIKLERGLKGLARSGSERLSTLLKSVQTFFGLEQAFAIEQEEDVGPLHGAMVAAQYGHMQKNSRIRGKYTTAQANIVTTLEEAIKMAYDRENLPAEVAAMKGKFDAKLNAIQDATDPKHYGIFIAQKLSEIPYMFLDTLHAKSIVEQGNNEDQEKPTFNLLKKLAGHETNKLQQNKVHERNEHDGPDDTRYTARSTVSRVKGRGFGWIKTTLGQQLKLFSPQLKAATTALLNDRGELEAAYQQTVAYRAILRYSQLEGGENLQQEFIAFVDQAVENMLSLLRGDTTPEQEMLVKDQTKEQKANPNNRHLISSARPDTVIHLNQDGAAYAQDHQNGNDAVLVEIRHPSKAFNLPYTKRTTNQSSRKDAIIAQRARRELKLMNDEKWIAAYKEAHPHVNTDERIEQEKQVFQLLAQQKVRQAYYAVRNNLGIAQPETDIYWKKWFGGYDFYKTLKTVGTTVLGGIGLGALAYLGLKGSMSKSGTGIGTGIGAGIGMLGGYLFGKNKWK